MRGSSRITTSPFHAARTKYRHHFEADTALPPSALFPYPAAWLRYPWRRWPRASALRRGSLIRPHHRPGWHRWRSEAPCVTPRRPHPHAGGETTFSPLHPAVLELIVQSGALTPPKPRSHTNPPAAPRKRVHPADPTMRKQSSRPSACRLLDRGRFQARNRIRCQRASHSSSVGPSLLANNASG